MKSVLCFLVLILVGCAHNPTQLRPGAFNTFDQNTHDFLRDAHDVLAAAAPDVAPLSATNPLKIAYNASVDALNAAQAGYKAYHAALEKGQTPDSSPVQRLLDGLRAAVAKYTAAKPTALLEWRLAA